MKIAKVKSRTPLRLPIDGGYTLVNEAVSSSRVSLEYCDDFGGCLRLYVDGRVSQSIPWHNISDWLVWSPGQRIQLSWSCRVHCN